MPQFQIVHKQVTLHTILVDALFQQTRYLAALAKQPNMLEADRHLTDDELSSRLRLHGLIVSLVCDVLAEHTTLARIIETLGDMHAEICETLRLDSNILKDRAISEYEIKRCILRVTLNDLLAIAGLPPIHY